MQPASQNFWNPNHEHCCFPMLGGNRIPGTRKGPIKNPLSVLSTSPDTCGPAKSEHPSKMQQSPSLVPDSRHFQSEAYGMKLDSLRPGCLSPPEQQIVRLLHMLKGKAVCKPERVCLQIKDPQNGGVSFGFQLRPHPKKGSLKKTSHPKGAFGPRRRPGKTVLVRRWCRSSRARSAYRRV